MNPEVQIIVPNFNHGSFIGKTLDSLFLQTYAQHKILVSDDASTDQSQSILKEYERRGVQIIYRKESTGNLFKHWNLLIENVSAPYVALYHSDDLYEPQILEKQVAFLESHPECDVVFTEARAIDSTGKFLWNVSLPKELRSPQKILNPTLTYRALATQGNHFLVCPSVLYRSSVFKRVGAFETAFPQSGDVEMWLRILFKGQSTIGYTVGYLDEPLMRVRYSMGQASFRYQKARLEGSDFFKVMDLYASYAPLSKDDQKTYEALRQLDFLHAGLCRLKVNNDASLLVQTLEWFSRPENKNAAQKLGGVDRIKVFLSQKTKPLFKTPLGESWAGGILKFSDLSSNPFLKMALQLKRKWSS